MVKILKYLSIFIIPMRTWELYHNGLGSATSDVIWKFKGEEDLYLVMKPLYLREAIISYSMVRCPPGQERNPMAVKSVLFLEDKTSAEFEQIFHESYPHFPLPEDIQENYDVMVRMQLDFMKSIGVTR